MSTCSKRWGIPVDPLKVVRVALQDAASVAGLDDHNRGRWSRITAKKEAPAMPGGGMGGMGGMDY